MGAIISKPQYERILGFIESAKQEGARLLTGGGRPTDPALAKGFFIEPTVFADVQPQMRIAREEIFGPVLSIFKWSDEGKMLEEVNAVEYGLTASIWTNDLSTAHRTAAAVHSGFVWINEVSKHFLGAPFGGYAGKEHPREAKASKRGNPGMRLAGFRRTETAAHSMADVFFADALNPSPGVKH
jgi:betaine-aldehyde dehydrogenase